jgi:serpin B
MLTENGSFHTLDGGQIAVSMMRQTESLGYAQGSGYQAVEMPYDGRELSMVILLPETGQFEAFEGALGAEQVENILKNVTYQQIALTMPKFEVESDFGLAEALMAMGMPDAFSADADFSGMTGKGVLPCQLLERGVDYWGLANSSVRFVWTWLNSVG